jgi:pyruvate kinase
VLFGVRGLRGGAALHSPLLSLVPQVAILLDTKGPEIRTGFLKEKTVKLERGQDLFISTDYSLKGDSEMIACSYADLPTSVEVGSRILAADGSLVMEVKEVREDGVMVEVMNDAEIGERKNMNLPGVVVTLPTITEKDKRDLLDFGVPVGVDFIAASFVRKGSDIDIIRETLGEEGSYIKIIAKIENQASALYSTDSPLPSPLFLTYSPPFPSVAPAGGAGEFRRDPRKGGRHHGRTWRPRHGDPP